MEISSKSPKLIYEEKKAIKLFLWLFYFLFFLYDLAWNVILPRYTDYGELEPLNSGLGIWLYPLVLILLLVSMYLIKKNDSYKVKYFFLFGYILIDLVDNLLRYYGTSRTFASGSVVELLFLIFSPVFVNKIYFWTTSLGIVVKYILLGLILSTANVLPPIIISTAISAIAYIILIRFYSYINSLTNVHEELRQKEKLAVIGQMATVIGHEIRNPLAALKGFTQLQFENNLQTKDYYPIMIQEIDRINVIVDDLMYLGKPRRIQFEKTSMEEIIDYTLSIMRQQAKVNGIKIEKTVTEPLPLIECGEKQLKQVFINLLKNAIEAMPNGGLIRIQIKMADKEKLLVAVEDEGCGITDETVQNLGTPFYSTKENGTGLGFYITKQIIEEHKGEIKIATKLGKGTTVEVELPLIQKY
ncbi:MULTISPECIES: ATP-binding protein [Neobacillus]|uniref:histidine kinase n=1 Tax=Neobacillus rhizophilus TaxID=2833579 RepID=A0A942YU60_9BACI|nr:MULTISPECIES: ATP-binding protein [Neobacillus]MBS4213658.1 GHKL domain-containing protein [Neobacillus rhizophilus]MBU8917936.1 GHKL domain-containing protein [Bacillus sp. FJAT-29953]